jgi:hypothetical protein
MKRHQVLLTKQVDGSYTAQTVTRVHATGANEAEALENLRAKLYLLQTSGRLVELDAPEEDDFGDDPWLSIPDFARDELEGDEYQQVITA